MVIAVAALSSPAWSATPEQDAVKLMQAGRSADAYRMLLGGPSEKRTSQSWFLQGVAAKDAGNWTEAKSAFRQALALSPNSPRIKLELARAAYHTGNSSEARQLFLDVKASNPPQQVAQNIDQFLAVIDAQPQARSNWRVRGSVGWMYDSNVNAGPTTSVVHLYGLPFVLSDDAKKQGDHALTLSAEIDHVARLDQNWSWQSLFRVDWRNYARMNRYDSVNFTVSSGPVWQGARGIIVSVPAFATGSHYDTGADYFSVTTGVAPQLRMPIDARTAFNLTTQVGYKHYRDYSDRDGWTGSVTPSLEFNADKFGTLRLGGQWIREDSDIGFFAFTERGATASWVVPLSGTIVAQLYGTAGIANYDDKEAAYDEKRRDHRYVFGADLTFRIPDIESDLILSASRTINQSNLPLYDYDRNLVSVRLRREF